MNARIKIGKKIREIRKSKNLTQEEVSLKSGVKRATVTNLENGRFDAKLSTIEKIADAINCDITIEERK
ncbi:MAG: helix-turn-helix transcriptional regulator [Porphyromonadaceae bacterium]|jgi:transcriptional regulator with XRE-family HTH domain|nr:helix-turn-helix transcriptional regulator [Porphyromonadaceae bacterium]